MLRSIQIGSRVRILVIESQHRVTEFTHGIPVAGTDCCLSLVEQGVYLSLNSFTWHG